MKKYRYDKPWEAYVFLAPWIIGFFAFTVIPMIVSLFFSFTRFDVLTPPEWIGLSNYVNLINDPRVHNSILVTLRFVVISIPLQLTFALLAAMALRKNIRGVRYYRAAFYLPSLLGGSVAIAILWRQVFNREGLFNMVLATFGIEGLNWIATPQTALYTLITLAIWQFGTPMIIFLGGLKQIPREYYEAAEVDGAKKVGMFFHITLPLLTPIVFFNVVMSIIGAFQAFTSAFIISGGTGGPVDSTMFYSLYLFIRGFQHFSMGYASALAWTLLV